MNFRQILLLTILQVSFLPLTAGEPKLSEVAVIRLANEAAKKAGYDLKRYDAPKAYYEYVHKDYSWWVSYQGKLRAPGNHFSVAIHDKTKKVEVLAGE
ncbi:MAG: hypothetical protein EOP84_11340 [Verrucomicrobiaceae bacterium]|nr:MAG: hypothetical protein EOP84_11340 [Verrucomicrobiaceae bacterium]